MRDPGTGSMGGNNALVRRWDDLIADLGGSEGDSRANAGSYATEDFLATIVFYVISVGYDLIMLVLVAAQSEETTQRKKRTLAGVNHISRELNTLCAAGELINAFEGLLRTSSPREKPPKRSIIAPAVLAHSNSKKMILVDSRLHGKMKYYTF